MEKDLPETDSETARAHLHEAQAAETAGRFPAIPAWLVLLDAALIAAFVLTQLVDSRSTELMALVAMILIFVNVAVMSRTSVAWSRASYAGTLIVVGLLAVTVGGSFLLYGIHGEGSIVVTGACLSAVAVLVAGLRYRKAAGRWQ